MRGWVNWEVSKMTPRFLTWIETKEADNMNRPITRSETEFVIKKQNNSLQKKSLWPDGVTEEFYQMYKELILFFSNSSKRLKGRELQVILWRHHSPDTKTRQTRDQKRKLQANIFAENRCIKCLNKILAKRIQQHKDHIPWLRWIHSRVTRLVQHTQINQCGTTSTTTKRQKAHDHFNRWWKSIW